MTSMDLRIKFLSRICQSIAPIAFFHWELYDPSKKRLFYHKYYFTVYQRYKYSKFLNIRKNIVFAVVHLRVFINSSEYHVALKCPFTLSSLSKIP